MKHSCLVIFALLLSSLTLVIGQEALEVGGSHVLKGRIVDEGDRPLSGVRVGLRIVGAVGETDAEGKFALPLKLERELEKDNTQTYEWVELDKEGFLGKTIEVKELEFFGREMKESLGPVVVTEEKAEFTMRMAVDDLLPSISVGKDFALITNETWEKWLAGMGERKKTGRTEQVVFQAYVPKGVAKVKAVFLLTRHGIGSIDHPRLRDFADRNGVGLVSVKGNPVQRGFYPVSLIDEPVARLGGMLKHPELGQAPVISFGHSNGTGFSGIFASRRPERVIGWISYHSGASWHLQFPGVEKVPGLVMHGLMDPFLKNGQVETVKNLRRERNAVVAMMLEANVAHGPADKGQNA
ncbi:MAG TPA: hypothetical protein VD994_09740, partial [Prosthecobacter sp.]|nr:hypothetical protein [Prosthecobacter sp.]